MEVLQQILENARVPVISAFILGLMTSISPCPLATNITAIAFIGKDVSNRDRVFMNGLIYTLGRAITYTGIGLIFFFGASQFRISGFIQQWGEKILGPLLIVIGIFMLDLIRINLPGFGVVTDRMEKSGHKGYGGVLLLGVLFALAFCPYSGVLYFGMLVPMTVASAKGLYLPLVFAIATGLPVIIFAWIVAYTMEGIGNIYNKVKIFELWFRRVVSALFIAVGIYYILITWI